MRTHFRLYAARDGREKHVRHDGTRRPRAYPAVGGRSYGRPPPTTFRESLYSQRWASRPYYVGNTLVASRPASNWGCARHHRAQIRGVKTGRSEERRVGKECVSTCRSRWLPYNSKKKPRKQTKAEL